MAIPPHNSNRTSVCPSCRREYEQWQGFEYVLCADCTDVRDEIYKNSSHSEEDIQKEMKKNLDKL